MKSSFRIPLSKVYIDNEIKNSVLRVLESGQYILGKECELFEAEFADFIGRKYAILVSSGTAALWLSLMSLGVKQKDEIIVPSHTAFPTVEPILALGAKPVFIDIDKTFTINPLKIEDKISKKTVGIIPVHLYGHPANMEVILKLAHKYRLFVIEDCCQAHGGKFKGKKVGSLGDIGCFSFYPSKNLTVCGDGGMVVTDSCTINDKIRMLRDHGRRSKYIHEVLGYNERFNEIQAIIGRLLLRRLNEFNRRRREIAGLYRDKLKNLPLFCPHEAEWAYHVYHMFVIRVKNRDRLAAFLLKKGIGTGIHYPVPCHLQPAIKEQFSKNRLPLTEEYCNDILSLPIYPLLSDEQVDYICKRIKQFFDSYRSI